MNTFKLMAVNSVAVDSTGKVSGHKSCYHVKHFIISFLV